MNDPVREPSVRLGLRSRRFGWSLFLAGIVYGMILGTFAFDGPLAAPDRLADYVATPRRMIRLAHIACMALGLVNVLYGNELGRVPFSDRLARVGSGALIVAGLLMPGILTLAAFQPAWKWGLPVPATAALVAVSVLVWGLGKEDRP